MNRQELGPRGLGSFLAEELRSRNWSQKDFSEITGLAESTICKVIKDKQPLSNETASAIGSALGLSTEYLLKLELEYKLLYSNQYKGKNDELIQLRAKCKGILPLSEMRKKGWLKGDNSLEGIKEDLISVFGTNNLESIDKYLNNSRFAARQTKHDEALTRPYCIAWFSYAKNVARTRLVSKKYDKDQLKKLFDNLWKYTAEKEGVASFLTDLEDCGVTFFVLEHLQKTFLDGAAFLVGDAPVIVYTARYDRIDNFWFVISHEIAHILLHYNHLAEGIFEIRFEDAGSDAMEREADEYASQILHKEEIISRFRESGPYFTTSRIYSLIVNTGIGIWVVMGILAHEKLIDYRVSSKYTAEKVLQCIPGRFNANLNVA